MSTLWDLEFVKKVKLKTMREQIVFVLNYFKIEFNETELLGKLESVDDINRLHKLASISTRINNIEDLYKRI